MAPSRTVPLHPNVKLQRLPFYDIHAELLKPATLIAQVRDILLRQSRLAQFYRDFHAKALLLVPPTELEIFYQDFCAKALLLVPPTELEIFYQDFHAKALLLVPPTELEIF